MKLTVKVGKPTYEDSSIVNAGNVNGYTIKSLTLTMSQLGSMVDNYYLKTANNYQYIINTKSTEVNNVLASSEVSPDKVKLLDIIVSASKVAEKVDCDAAELKNFMGTVFAVYEDSDITDDEFIGINSVLKQLSKR